jgi:hemoglobin/transferrin/lactoferrin receptor protein
MVNGLIAQKTITVINAANEPLIGVNIYSKDFSFHTSTDNNGNFVIPILEPQIKIHFKYLGFEELVLSYRRIQNGPDKIILNELEEIIEEVVIIGRNDARKEDLPYTLDYLKAEEIVLTNAQTSADALQNNAEVYVQKSQMGGGSPVIRGFEANRVLLVVDGIRLNNAIYRNGHLQNAITVDQAMLKQTEVLYGPGSLIYGSDALGGVVHFRTRNPVLNFSSTDKLKVDGSAFMRFSSANKEQSYHLDINLGVEKFGALTSFSYSDFRDLKMGANRSDEYPTFGMRNYYVETGEGGDVVIENKDPNLQVGTAYKQYDFLQKFLFQATENVKFIANFQYSTSSDIPRYDALIEEDGTGLNYAEWYYGPQKRILSSLTTKIMLNRSWADELIIIPSYQFIEEDRISRQFQDNFRDHNEENVKIAMLTLDFKKKLSKNSKLMYGLDLNRNHVTSIAYSEDINTGNTENNILTRYPGGESSLTSFGAFTHYQVQALDSSVRIFTGFRINRNSTELKFSQNPIVDWPSDFITGLVNNNNSLTWSLGINYLPSESTIIRAIASSAFRSPNVDDLAKIRVKSDEISFPNLDLKPEKSINFELGLTQEIHLGGSSNINFNITGFYTRLKDVIIRQPFTSPEGDQYFVNKGDSLEIVANVNAQKAYIAGVSSNIKFLLGSSWSLKSSFNYTKGRVLEENAKTPLSHIPPIYGNIALNFTKKGFKHSLIFRYNGKKSIDEFGGSSDNIEFATPEGALAWYTINYYASYAISKSFQINLGIENILDQHYRPFASGLSGSGRNANISIRTTF